MRAFFTSMQGRVFFVVIGGIVASALLTAALADLEGRRTFAQVRAAHTADRVEQLVGALEAVSARGTPDAGGDARKGHDARSSRDPDAGPQEKDTELTDALVEELGPDRNVTATAGPFADCVARKRRRSARRARPSPRARSFR